MDIFELVTVEDCPVCGGPGVLEEENGREYYVMCWECGARTVNIGSKTEEGKLEAAQKAAHLWNIGKAIPSEPGE